MSLLAEVDVHVQASEALQDADELFGRTRNPDTVNGGSDGLGNGLPTSFPGFTNDPLALSALLALPHLLAVLGKAFTTLVCLSPVRFLLFRGTRRCLFY